MKHLLIFLLAFPFFASAQILEKQFVATVQYGGFTQINDSLYRGDLNEFRDVLIEGYQPSGVDSGFICLDGTGRAYRVEVVNSFDYSSLNVDLVELDDYDEIPIGVGIVAERYGSTYQIPNGLVNSIGISAVLQAKILNHNTKIAATTVQPPDTLYLQELSGTSAISDGDTIPLIDYVRVVDTPAMLLNYPSTAGYGIIDGGKTWRADTSDPSGLATRLFAKTLPTSIAANYIATSNGSNLVARNLFDNDTYAGVLNSKPWKFGSWTTAGRPTGIDGYYGKNTTTGFLEGYYTSQWENLISSTGASANQVPYFTSAGQIAGNSRHSITPSTGEQTITLNNAAGQADYIITASTPMSNGSTTINYGIRYYTSNQLWFGQLNNGSYIRWSGSGGQAALIGLWTFPTDASYPAPMHLGSDGSSGGDVRVTVLKSGNVANARINMYARRYGLANDAPSWTNGASFFQWGTMNAVTPWNQGYDTLRFKLNQNGDVQIGANTSGAADYTWSTNALLHVRGRQTSSQKIFRFDARSGTEYMNLTNSGNLNLFNVSETNKGGTVTIKNSSAATTSILGSGFIRLLKPSSGRFGGNLFINDTTGVIDNSFYLGQDDDGSIQALGSGPQITHTFNNTKLPGQFRWAYAVRADTSMPIGTIRIVQGDRYASATVPVTHRFYAGLQATETEPAYYFTSAASDGKLAFRLNSSLYVRQDGKVYFASDSTFSFDPSTDVLQLSQMGAGTKEAADLSKTQSNFNATFATDGTIIEREQKRDTTIYVIDTDYDFSAAVTTTQVGNRYNRVIFLMTTTAAAGSDSELTLHTPDANLMQVEYLVRSTDEAGGFANKIVFGTNNAVDSTNGLVTNYFPAAGQGVGIRAGLRSAAYKYFYY